MAQFRAMTMAGLLLLTGSAAKAQQTAGWKAGAAIPYSMDSLSSFTNRTLMGLCLDGAYQVPVADSTTFIRLGLGLNAFPGQEKTSGTLTRKVSFMSEQVTADVIVPISTSRWALVAGISANNWHVNSTLRDSSDPAMEGTSGAVKKVFGKFGFRTGLEYQVASRLALTALFQQTELGSDARLRKGGDDIYGYQGINPSWIQVGIRYSF
ncbi:hypothetical protein [Geothrix sp. PMB-07]|uniref:hypothetical protein n=1 Tax=Geothrix sp. PMB-07 TaxID=3068640 RepID=UPI00274084E1|nr:hypothetical protein [Geothrix sp. PMB-07]WLT32273.1 hypothetical protein Q9293_02860 [Geothrix sp. PMB-07]